ncbi:hypothetical protein Bhyg_01957, partial [Pseudolycoriella hygida]
NGSALSEQHSAQQHHNQHEISGTPTPNHTTELKQHTSPAGGDPSMGVYTPDSTTNSVHSLHHYSQCDIDVTQLGLESPASISSDIASQNSVENVRPPSVVSHGTQMSQFSDCSMQQQVVNQTHMHMAIQQHNNMTVPTSSPQQQALLMANNMNNQNQQSSSRTQQMQQYHLSASMSHSGHHQSMNQDYLAVPTQMISGATSQNFSAQSPNSYSSIPMTTVIQHRMSGSNTTHNPLPSPHQQRLGPSPLSKLQQLTNGLEMIQPCNTPPSGSVNLTPPPNHHPHNTMTPPPSHLVQQNRNLPTPPASLQTQMSALQYHKYYAGNMNVAPPISVSQNSARVRNTASAPVQHMSASSSRASPNVTISSNLMSPYSSLNGYRMTTQQPAGSVASYTASAGFNPGQLPVQMGVMNMQSQYQAQAQQNSMYSTYAPYIPLNGTMRR